MFEPGTDAPTDLLERLIDVVGNVFGSVTNSLAIAGYSRSHAVVLQDDVAWPRSISRAEFGKVRLEDAIDPARIQRVTGHGDRSPAVPNPMSLRNDRLELTLLRNDL